MKQYVIDQLRESDYERIRDFLDSHAEKTVFEDIYWLEVPEDLYSTLQGEHTGCHPYYLAVSLDRRQVAFEWLVRSRQTMRCKCIGYATQKQRDFLIDFADRMLEELGIKV